MGSALRRYLAEDPFRKIDLTFILEQAKTFRGESRDLGLFLGTLKKLLYEESQHLPVTVGAKKLKLAINHALDALHRSMMAYAYGDLYVNPPQDLQQSYLLGFFKGLSVWVPQAAKSYQHRINEFSKSRLFKLKDNEGERWKHWMDEVYDSKGPGGPFIP